MMVSLADGLFGLGMLVGILLCWLGYYSYRTWNQPGVTAFAAFVTILGFGGIVSSSLGVFLPGPGGDALVPLWGRTGILFWALSGVPWVLFALEYTGRHTRITRRTVGLLLVPFVGIGVNVVLEFTGIGTVPVANFIGSTVFVYSLGLVIVGAYLLLRTTYAYGHLSFEQGVSLSVAPLVVFLSMNSISMFGDSPEVVPVGLYVGGMGLAMLTVGTALFRYDTFDSTPAVGTIGERAIARETDDLIVVVDDDNHVIKLNDATVETLDVSRADSLGVPLQEVVGDGVDTFRDRETVTLETTTGEREYDPQISTVTDQHGRELGWLLSLRDVTERELREQRLSVLNRVLRHNLRNKVEIVKTHAEVLDDEIDEEAIANGYGDGHTEAITETADEIAGLGERARTIDQFVSDSATEQSIDLADAIERTLETLDADTSVTVDLDIPDSPVVVTNGTALEGALESALDNAITYADSRVSITVTKQASGYRVTIADDGPGIPDAELDAIESERETALQHGTGLGLWQLRWAVTTIGGELSFETADGTTVEFTVPDRDQVSA